MALKHLIQNKLLDYIETSTAFREVSYDSDNRASVGAVKAGSAVLASRHANEISCNFVSDPRNGRDRKQQRGRWIFSLRAVFQKEVSVEEFEEQWLNDPPILTREDTSSKQVTLFLISSEIHHPPQQSSSTGTRVEFTILAELSRN